jgi:hypothetical protein
MVQNVVSSEPLRVFRRVVNRIHRNDEGNDAKSLLLRLVAVRGSDSLLYYAHDELTHDV